MKTLETTIATQRKQLADHIHIADKAREQEDLEMWAQAARNAADVAKSLNENLEQQNSMRLSDLSQFTAGALIDAALKSYKDHGDKTFLPALKKAQTAVAAKKTGGARVGG